MNAIPLKSLKSDLAQRRLTERKGPRLSDGTYLRDLFNFEKREVSLRLLQDPEIHALEMERIFGRSWIAVGHESEIPNPGDFLLRPIGEDRVIVSRAKDGSVNILLNACAHRGMEVCFAERGNASTFKCPYHAWVYDNTGKLLGVPFEKQTYGDNWDKSGYGLTKVNVTVRHGIIFGYLGKNPPSLEEYMGDMLWYFDKRFGGVEWQVMRGGMGRNLIPANWKANLDQNNGDVLHTVGIHHDFTELGVFGQDFGQFTTKVHTPPTGHFLTLFEPNFGGGDEPGAVSQTKEIMDSRSNLPFDQRGFAFLLFPTTFGGGFAFPSEKGVMRFANISIHVPHGVDKFEFMAFSLFLIPKDAPQELLDMIAGLGIANRGVSGGQFEDNEAWRSMTNAARGPATRKAASMKYPACSEPKKPEGWEGPGTVYDGISDDSTQWHGWLHYFDVMTRDEA